MLFQVRDNGRQLFFLRRQRICLRGKGFLLLFKLGSQLRQQLSLLIQLLILIFQLCILILQLTGLFVQCILLSQKFGCIPFLKCNFIVSFLQAFIITFLSLKKRHAHDQDKKEQYTGHHIGIGTPHIKAGVLRSSSLSHMLILLKPYLLKRLILPFCALLESSRIFLFISFISSC